MARKGTRDINRCRKLTEYIRGKIVSGEWAPGMKLPVRKYFEENFGAANTIQSAFSALLEEGFLTAAPRLGTCVSFTPPHLNRFAVLLYGTAELKKSCHQRALYQSVCILRKEGWNIEPFFLLDSNGDEPECVSFLQRVREHCFAGVFAEATPVHWKRFLFDACREVPLTGYLEPDPALNEDALCRASYTESFHGMLKHLKSSEVKRLAVLNSVCPDGPPREHLFRELIEAAGLNCPAGYYLEISERYSLAENICRLLFSPSNTQPPDGLVLYNDNFLPYAAKVLHELYGTQIEKRVHVVSICNYPVLPVSDFPVYCCGFDQPAIMRSALEYMARLRRGETASPPAMFFYDGILNDEKRFFKIKNKPEDILQGELLCAH